MWLLDPLSGVFKCKAPKTNIIHILRVTYLKRLYDACFIDVTYKEFLVAFSTVFVLSVCFCNFKNITVHKDAKISMF